VFSNDELENIFRDYVDKNNGMVAYRPLILMLDRINHMLLEEELAKVGDPHFQLEWVTTTKELPFVEHRNDVISIGSEIKALGLSTDSTLPDSIEKHIAQHVRKFGWLFTHHYLGDPMTREDVLFAVGKFLDGSLTQESNDEVEEDNPLDVLKAMNPNIARHIGIAQDFAYLRTYRIDIATEGDFYFRVCFDEIAKRMGVTYDDFIHLAVDEITGWFGSTVNIDTLKETIRKRKEYFVTFLVEDNQIYWFEGKENEKSKITKERPDNLVLRGKVAQRGKITGRAKVVFCKEEGEKIQDGDILVSPMTTPEMMVAIMKCAGIVTDEGGVACHAAQISREFNIPCIIGTGDATSLLHDGDLVEILADGIDGTVKLI
jgi:phosphoenolpyruvate synthase/pyruvate phosphate dikinase